MTAALAGAQSYDYVIPLGVVTFDAAAEGVSPGDVVGIEPGERQQLRILNAAGSSGNPIIFVNAGGKVRIGNSSLGEAIYISNSSYFELRGDGDSSLLYGIEIWSSGVHGVEATGESTNYEICFLEISNCGFAGIVSKTDPQCNGTGQRANFTQYDVSIHDNYVHDVGGEALYIGNSFYSGYSAGCGTLYPHNIIGLRVYNNRVERTGWDGIQVGCASSDVEIYDNYINETGLESVLYQMNGMQIGEGTTGKCYGNVILNAGAMGIIMLGLGNNDVYNNVIVNAAENGIFCDNRPDTLDPSYVRIYNNTIIEPTDEAFRCYNELSTVEFKNNLVVISDTGVSMLSFLGGISIDTADNVFLRGTSTLDFVDESSFDFRIGDSSAALDVAGDLSAYGVTEDLEGNARPFNSDFDAGAFEYGDLSVWVGFEDISINGVADGSIDVVPLGGIPPYTYLWSDASTASSRSGLAAREYSVTVTDDNSVSIGRTIWLIEPSPLVTNETVRPEIAGSSDGSVEVSAQGGTPPYTIAWDHGPTTFSLSGLDAGFYGYTVTDDRSDTTPGVVFVADAGTPIYRINCGGPEETDTHLNWSRDTQTYPSAYLASTSQYTTGSYFWNGDQSTLAPDDILGAYRYDTSLGSEMEWEFPVSSGFYALRLYFNERNSAIGIGDRVFDVEVEGTVALDDLDIFATSGYNVPTEFVLLVEVTDGYLDVDFVRDQGDSFLTAIAVHALSGPPAGTPVYRINSGGVDETGTGLDWTGERQTVPSPYLVSTSQLTTGSWSWSSGGTNFTEAPDDLFGNYRYDLSYGEEMSWEFPAEPGIYRVSLFFIERDASATTGSRMFDVFLEGAVVLTSYDLYDTYGYLIPVQEDFYVSPVGSVIDIDFDHVSGAGDPLISGIQIERIE